MKRILIKTISISNLLIVMFSSKLYSQANDYNCCIKNITQSSLTTIEFDVWIEWTGSNSQKLTFFQAGINFNYIGIANGGTITGAFKPGSADPSLAPVQQLPNWNINQTSKQIRMLAAIATTPGIAASIPSPPGFRLGTFIMTNTVAFTPLSTPNFVWSFVTGTSTTSRTQISAYINGATTGTNITIPAQHCIEYVYNPCTTLPPCFANHGGPYVSCGDIHLNGEGFFESIPSWSTSGTGTFDPNINTLNAIYHPSASDLTIGSVTLSLSANSSGPCCGYVESSTTVTFTSINDNDICTIDGCDQSTGLPTHSAPQCVTLNSSIFIEGFYTGNGMMNNNGAGGFLYVAGVPGAVPTDADRIKISAMQPNPPYGLVDQQTVILHTDGSVSVTFSPSVVAGNSYYIKIRHRNSVETWSANPALFSNVTNYSFSVSSSQAYSNNLIQTPDNLYYAIFNGDINQDCAIDGTDFLELNIGIQNGLGGYLSFDLNGDGTVDGADFLLLDYNIQNGFGCP